MRSNKGFPPHAVFPNPANPTPWHGTTILTVRKGGVVAVGGDGQVSIGQTIVKANAKKVRRLGKGDVIGGFAGATADAFTLFERLEAKLEQYPGQLTRAAVELAKDWRTDRYLRRLEAMMIVADKEVSLVLTGTGDVLEPEAGIVGIGSGGNYALAAARALADGPLDAEAIVRRALDIAADICVYTNRNVTVETSTVNATTHRRPRGLLGAPRRWRTAMLEDDDLDAAIAAGIISTDQVEKLRAFADGRRRSAERADDERFRFMRGFNDFFFAVGIVLFGARNHLFCRRQSAQQSGGRRP